jgi:hypothetical protein
MKTLIAIGKMRVIEKHGRWYLYDGDEWIAERITPRKNENPLTWLEKKCVERFEAQKRYETIITEQLVAVKNQVYRWQDRMNDVAMLKAGLKRQPHPKPLERRRRGK